jgi:4-diphosphocytidyl-2C-methyl-D-erythritol kinase
LGKEKIMSNSDERDEELTGTPDEHYNLVSVLYHALDVAETFDIYIEDAEDAEDQELADFFSELQEQNQQVIVRAKQLLKQRLS